VSLLLLPCFIAGFIQGINFYGLETPSKDLVCSWKHPPEYYLEKMSEMGFNTVRLPFSMEWVHEGDFSKMDSFFESSQQHSFQIVLDAHRNWASHQGPNPMEDMDLSEFIHRWTVILDRYQNQSSLLGVDVFNENQGEDSQAWNGILIQIIQSLENRYPGRFVYYAGGTHWGGDLHDINLSVFPFQDRIKYTIHKYIFTSHEQFETDWDWSFGPFANQPGKVVVGEWGFKQEEPEEVRWTERFIRYLKQHGIQDTFFWTVAVSMDTNGLWQDDCETVNEDKLKLIQTLWETLENSHGNLRKQR